MQQFVYFDHNATAPVMTEVTDLMSEVMAVVGNASSTHTYGRHARQKVEDARISIANLIGAKPSEVIFTSGGTEANNLALSGITCDHVLVSAVEHKSILDATDNIEQLSVDNNGLINLEGLEARLGQITGQVLISVMLANNETGIIQPVSEVSRIARKYGALVHTDAVQAFGKIHVDRGELGVDFISLSAHKMGGPQGVGALIINENIPLDPLIKGGGQERGHRAGTENIPGIAGFGIAAEKRGDLGHISNIRTLRDELEILVNNITSEAIVFGENIARLPNTSCISIPGINSQTQVMKFDLAGIMVGAGSACSSGKVETSHVLKAMGVNENLATSAIRISLGPENTMEDVEYFIRIWEKIYSGNCPNVDQHSLTVNAAE